MPNSGHTPRSHYGTAQRRNRPLLTDRTYHSELPEHWVVASQLTRQTFSLMLPTRSAPVRELAKLIYQVADDGILCERWSMDELDAWHLLFQQTVAQLRSDEGFGWMWRCRCDRCAWASDHHSFG